MEIVEAEWEGHPTFLISIKNDKGEVIQALRLIFDGKPIWTNRIEMAWHHANRLYVEKVLSEIKDK
jgi:hypothetical protein